eukprot:3208252-Rhodomonas_salina.2
MAASGNKPVITRFAPSPTGKSMTCPCAVFEVRCYFSATFCGRHWLRYLHIGGGRTALFSYLYAKHHGGQFRLRIEDTDADRHDEEAAKAIINGMEWLGCKHDGEIVRQSQQKARHQEVANKLVAENKAYKCYCSKEELEAMRAEADKNKVPFRYPGKCRDVAADFTPPAGVEPVVRIKTEVEGSTKWTDKVRQSTAAGARDDRVSEQGHRRLHHPALGRQPDVLVGGGCGRPRHGDHGRDPRLGPHLQHAAPAPDLQAVR